MDETRLIHKLSERVVKVLDAKNLTISELYRKMRITDAGEVRFYRTVEDLEMSGRLIRYADCKYGVKQ